MGVSIGREAILLGTIAQVMPDPIFVIDNNGAYLEVIGGTERSLYGSGNYLKHKTLHDIFRTHIADRFLVTVKTAIDSGCLQVVEYELSPSDMKHVLGDGPAGTQWFEGRVLPFEMLPGRTICVLWFAINITEKKLAEGEIKTLKGMLPLCCHCMKVRDDAGYWKQVDDYLRQHTDADITHSVCPECMKEFHGDLVDDP